MKKILILLLGIFVLLGTGCSCSKKKEKEPIEESIIIEVDEKDVTSDQIVDGIRFKNASLVIKDGRTEFRVTLENTITTVKKISHLEIIFKGENENIIKTVNHYDFNNMKKGDTKSLSYTFSSDMSAVKKIEYKYE